jgi:hypothetical protein
VDPIEQAHRDAMEAIMKALAELFPGMGITLMIFDLGDKGRMNYVSNADRADMLIAMKEFIARHEGRMPSEPAPPQ